MREGEQALEDPTAAAQDDGAWLKLRDDGDHRRLALQILKSLSVPEQYSPLVPFESSPVCAL